MSVQVWVRASTVAASMLNDQRTADDAFSPAVLDALGARFEVPNEADRWDTPLFTVDNSHAASLADMSSKTADALDAAHPGAGAAAAAGGAVFSAEHAVGDTTLHADDTAAYATTSGVAPSGSTLDRVRIVAAGDGAGGAWKVVHVGSQVTHIDAPPSSQGAAAPDASLAALTSTGEKAFQLRPAHLRPGANTSAATSAFKRKAAPVRAKAAGQSAFRLKAGARARPLPILGTAAAEDDQDTFDAASDAASAASSGGDRSLAGADDHDAPAADAQAFTPNESASLVPVAESVSVWKGWPQRVLEDVAGSILSRRGLRATAATQRTAVQHAARLHQLDTATSQVAANLLAILHTRMVGDSFSVEPAQAFVVLSRHTTRAEVQRLRAQFLKLAAGRVSSDAITRSSSEMGDADMFVQFLNAALRRAAI